MVNRRFLLGCGIASSLLYVVMVLLVPAGRASYSASSQTISELSAIGAPTRSLWMWPAVAYTVLVCWFGWAVHLWAAHRLERRAGRVIFMYGALGVLWPIAPMHLRETLAAGGGDWHDAMHVVLAAMTVSLMCASMALAAAAAERAFRWYSLASVAILVPFGGLTFIDAPRVAANLPTPWLGVWERISVGVFLLWIVVFAVVLLRRRDAAGPSSAASLPSLTRQGRRG